MAYGYKYRLEVTHWSRSRDGDDWIDSEYWINTDTIAAAMERVSKLVPQNIIEVRLYRMTADKQLIYKRDYMTSEVFDDTWKHIDVV